MNRFNLRRLALGSASLIALFDAVSFAQTAAVTSGKTEEIVVTAQKREERLRDVPIAITVATSAQLARQHIDTVADLDRISPAVQFVDGAPGGGAEVRGLGTQTFSPSAEASVGIVVDGVPQGNVNQSNIFDMARVEVLRGPQGMLFGQSASAGLINMVTMAPQIGVLSAKIHTDLAGKGDAGSKYGQQVVQAVVNIPINDRSALRVAGFINNVDGVLHDNYTGKNNQDVDAGLRARYKYEFGNQLTANLSADFDREHQRGESTFVQTYIDPASPFDNTGAAAAACGIVANAKNTDSCSALGNYTTNTNGGGSIELDKGTDYLNYTSITAFRERKAGPQANDISDLNGIAPTVDNPYACSNLQQASQEFRIANPSGATLEYTAGVYLAAYQSHTGGAGTDVTLALPFGVFQAVNQGISSTKTKTEALFGQVDYHLAPQWHVTLGLRATHENLDDAEQLYSQAFNPPIGSGAVIQRDYHLSDDVNNLSGKVGVNYKPVENNMIYASVARGFKGPQLNDTVASATPYVVPPEQPLAFEIGDKAAFLSNRLSVDTNLFDTNVKNYQGQSCTSVDSALVCGSAPIPHVISKGLEVDIYGKILPDLSVNIGYIYDLVRYPNGYIGDDGTDLSGAQLAGAPKNKITFSGEYTYDLPMEYTGFVDLDAVYKSGTRVYPSISTLYILKANTTMDARIGVETPGAKYKFALFVRNAFDQPEPANIYPGINDGVMSKQGQEGERVVGLSFDGSF